MNLCEAVEEDSWRNYNASRSSFDEGKAHGAIACRVEINKLGEPK